KLSPSSCVSSFVVTGIGGKHLLERGAGCQGHEQFALLLASQIALQDAPPSGSQFSQPIGIARGKLLFELFPKATRECRTLSGRRNRDLQIPAFHKGGVVEVALFWNIHHVAQHVPFLRLGVGHFVQIPLRGRDDGKEYAIQVRGNEAAFFQCKLSGARPLANRLSSFERNDSNVRSGVEQSANFGLANAARADNQYGLSMQLHEHGEQARCERLGFELSSRCWHTYPSIPCGTRPGERSRATGSNTCPARNSRSSVSL